MKRMVKIVLIAFILVGIAVPQLSCGSESGETEAMESQIVTVERGTLTVEITAAGNLALSRTEDRAFDLFYPEGTVGEVLVEEGDIVEEGQVLAKVDTEEWEDELGTLEDQVTTKERDLLQAQINLQTAEQNLKDSRDNKAAKELALLNAQINLDQANYNLSVAEETHTWPDIETAEAEVDKAEAFLQWALDGQAESGGSTWDRLVTRAQAELDAAQKVYDALVEGYDTEEVAIKKKQVEAAEMSLAQAQEDLDKIVADVTLKELQLTLNQGKLEDARKALVDAQQELEKAKSKSPLIVAPFAGFITKVNVEGGDDIMTGTVAVQLADPNRFEADIMVSEMDILQVKLGGDATVQVDAMPGLSLPAKITHIAPTATIQSGVVNYQVKVEVQPLEQRQAGQQPQTQISPTIPEGFQLREGLTVTVTIIVQQKTDVLLVPNAAITSQGGQSYVQVVSPDGATEQRAIKTGISDYQFTEVTEGLSEGEQILVPKGTATTATTTQPARPPMMIPGMGPPSR